MSEYKAPLRVSFTGCATDVPARLGFHTGRAVCATIDKFMRVTITTNNHEPPLIEPECDLITDLLDKMPFDADIPRMQIKWQSDIPLGNGLGGSSALLVAIAKHFFRTSDYQAHFASNVELARNAGWQDAAISAWGGCREFAFRHDGFLLAQSFALPDPKDFMLVSMNQTHNTAKQLANPEPHGTKYMTDNYDRCQLFIDGLRAGNRGLMGHILDRVHEVKSERPNYLVEGVDKFLDNAKKYGAYGGCILGSGGGGHILLVVDHNKINELKTITEFNGYTHVPFNFL